MHVLLVEDDEIIGKAICHSLMESQYSVEWLQDGEKAEACLLSQEFSAVILDVALPTRSGLEILRSVRSQGLNTPILLLSAKNSSEDIVQGLDAGADVYVTKPFSLSVLSAWLRALQRRSGQQLHMPTPTPARAAMYNIASAGLRLDPNSYSVYVEGERISISRREYTLLNKLLENVGEVVPREALSKCIYGAETEVESNAVEVHVHNLRKKLRDNIIKTIRGVGYIVDAPRSVKSEEALSSRV